jgi:hypothetical protein
VAPRKKLSDAVRTAVLKEFNHRCAICGTAVPQIHHIDEDHDNNDPENLLPLCPNCHLLDQHNPTAKTDPQKLSLFRNHKDPFILVAQFEPLFQRMKFLLSWPKADFDSQGTRKQAAELVAFVSHLQMGVFYSGELLKLLEFDNSGAPIILGDTFGYSRWYEGAVARYAHDLQTRSPRAVHLIMEVIRFQNWPKFEPPHKRSGAS